MFFFFFSFLFSLFFFFFQAEDGIRDRSPSRGLGDVYKRQGGITAVEFLRDEEENTCGDTTDFSGCASGYPQDSIPTQTPVAPVTEFRSEAVSAPVESSIQTPVSNAVPLDTFRAQKEIKSLLFITEQYLGKTLTHTDVDTITYFYDTLHMSADLIEYLIESCVENGHKSMHYIQKVAISWVENGVETISQAKEQAAAYSRNCYTVLNAFGIKNRGCLLYTSDAADEEDSGDLGGRRIIEKKGNVT